jgi:long-chain acyl-CoA synthetase
MLENRWRETARRNATRLAVHDATSGRSWTFSELEAEADAAPGSASEGLSHPQGRDVGFLLAVLRAWRAGLPICPLEPGQSAPVLPRPIPGFSLLKLTSGSTGTPRVVALDAAQVAADADQIVRTMGLRPEWPNLGVLSLAHSYGFSNLVTPLLLHGIPLVLVDSPLPRSVAAAAAPWESITLPAVPALWRSWHEADLIPRQVRLAVSAGAPLPLPLEQEVFERHGLKIHNFLGASECGGIAFDRSDVPRTDPTCVGLPLEGVEASVDEDGTLVVHGPAVASTYWPEPDPRLADGTYRSSDLVHRDDEGRLWLRGRVGDVINVAGRKVFPGAVEQAALRHPAVLDCLAFGVPDSTGRGEAVGLVYSTREPIEDSDLRAFLSSNLSAWEVPRRWWHRPALGADGRGKRPRHVWRAMLLGEG